MQIPPPTFGIGMTRPMWRSDITLARSFVNTGIVQLFKVFERTSTKLALAARVDW